MKIFNKKESGFTLVELVVVVAVVGVLAVVATPKIVSVASNARVASLSGVVQSLTSANARNFAIREAEGSDGDAVTSCTTALNTVEAGALPTGYVLSLDPAITAFLKDNSTYTAGDIVTSTDTTAFDSGTTYNCAISTTSTPVKTGVFVAVGVK
jgi:MSHA pilin protein MshA